MLFSVNHREFEALKAAYPHNADLLESLVERIGPKSIIQTQLLTQKRELKWDPLLYDHIYRTAYEIREEHFWSYGLQLRGILSLPKSRVNTILEIGPGNGMLRNLLIPFDYTYRSIDIKPYNQADIRGDVQNLPLKNNAVDLICAFEVLQHLPHSLFSSVLKEIARSARHYVYLSLPYPTNSVSIQARLSLLNRRLKCFSFALNRLWRLPTRLNDKNEQAALMRKDRHNPHYWEINRPSYPESRVLDEIQASGLRIVKTFHSHLHPYHFFILCEVQKP